MAIVIICSQVIRRIENFISYDEAEITITVKERIQNRCIEIRNASLRINVVGIDIICTIYCNDQQYNREYPRMKLAVKYYKEYDSEYPRKVHGKTL